MVHLGFLGGGLGITPSRMSLRLAFLRLAFLLGVDLLSKLAFFSAANHHHRVSATSVTD